MEEAAKTQGEQPEQPIQLTPEQIQGMNPMARAAMCAEAVNSVLKDFNCIFNPIAHISNQGINIQVKITPLAYPVMPEPIDPLHVN